MNAPIVICISEDRRLRIIDNHSFYMDQFREKFLPLLSDDRIEEEAERTGEGALDQFCTFYDPHSDNGGDLQERAFDRVCDRYHGLNQLRRTLLLSACTTVYHDWEKQVRLWLTQELGHSQLPAVVKKAVWKSSPIDLFAFLKRHGHDIENTSFYKKLDECRLVANIFKHGFGKSFERLADKAPRFITGYEVAAASHSPWTQEYLWTFFEELEISEADLGSFSDAILAF